MRKICLLLTSCFLIIQVLAQKTLQPADPSTVGMSAERLQRIDKVMQEYVDKKWMPGATILIARNGKIVYHKAIGYNNVETKTALQKDAIFRIASQTKAITSVAVMLLYEEGRFLLDDPIGKYIPAFKKQVVLDKFNEADTTYTTVPAKRSVTIRDLLTHSSGIDYAQIGSPQANAIYAKNGLEGGIGVGKVLLADKMNILGSLPLMHQPGEKWTYGLNTDLLGYLVEVVSGMKLDEFFRTRIFEPLGMKDTYFYLPKDKYSRLVKLSTESDAGETVLMKESIDLNGKMEIDYPNTEGTYFSGGAGLNCTALDYGIFLQMMLNNGAYNGKQLLSPTSVRLMTSIQYAPPGWNDSGMGLGFGVVNEAGSNKIPQSAGTYDWGGFFSSSYWVDPKQKIVAQLFINQYPHSHGEIHSKFKALVYQAIVE